MDNTVPDIYLTLKHLLYNDLIQMREKIRTGYCMNMTWKTWWHKEKSVIISSGSTATPKVSHLGGGLRFTEPWGVKGNLYRITTSPADSSWGSTLHIQCINVFHHIHQCWGLCQSPVVMKQTSLHKSDLNTATHLTLPSAIFHRVGYILLFSLFSHASY